MGKQDQIKAVSLAALEKIQPSASQVKASKEMAKDVLRRVNKTVKPAVAVLGGSGAKDTYLAGKFDMDIFVPYPYAKYKDRHEQLSDLLAISLRKAGFKDLERIHGSRDYFRLSHQAMQFEIIPILKVGKAQHALNITDVSPLHSKWVNKHASKQVKDQIRLTKAFCRGIGIYGAESYIRGFSGYVCEVLTIHYGSFLNVLKASQRWKPGTTIDTMKLLKGKPAFSLLNKAKLQSPLIVIDPVQVERNAAAALSEAAFLRFKAKAASFMAKPDASYFERIFSTPAQIKKRFPKATVVSAQPIEAKEDVAGTALLKAFEYLCAQLEKSGFLLEEADWDWDKQGHAVLWFVPRNEPLPNTQQHLGPPAKYAQHAAAFKKRYPSAKVVKGQWVATIPREHRTVASVIAKLIIKDPLLPLKAKRYTIE